MDEITPTLIARLLGAIPESIQALPAWVLWRAIPERGKVPFYSTNGSIRRGVQNGPEDAAHLLPLDRAIEGARALRKRGERFQGFGIALAAPHRIVALDLDNKNEDPERERLHDELIALAPGCYVERSPSGKGRRVLLAGNGLDDAKAHALGVETFVTKGFCTLTGAVLAGAGALVPITDALRERIRKLMVSRKARESSAGEGRSADILRMAARLRQQGSSEEAILAACRQHTNQKHTPPLDEERLRDVVGRYANRDAFAWLPARFRYIAGVDHYFDCEAGQFLVPHAVDTLVANRMPIIAGKELKPTAYLSGVGEEHKFAAVGYHPGEGAEYVENGARVLNLYVPPKIAPTTGDAEPLVRHLAYLVDESPDDDPSPAFLHLVRWLAHLVQRPGQKIAHGILHVNPNEGTGRGWLLAMLAAILGSRNVVTLDEDRLASRFNDYLLRCQLLRIPEMESGETRRSIALRLKPILSDERLRVEAKGLAAFDITNRVNVLATSNRLDATHIPLTDRRWWVWASEARPKPTAYYDALYSWLHDPATPGVILDYFLRVDLSKFNAYARPECTLAKAAAIEASRPAVEQYLLDALTGEQGPFERELVILGEVLDWLNQRGQRGLSAHRLGDILKASGGLNLGQKRVPTGRPHVWAVRKVEFWRTASENLVFAHFRPPEQESEGNRYARRRG